MKFYLKIALLAVNVYLSDNDRSQFKIIDLR